MEYTVVGDNGVVEFSSDARPARVYWKNGESELLPATGIDPFAEELGYFVECCRLGKSPERCPPRESALAVWAAQLMVHARDKKGEKVKCEFRTSLNLA
jgi:hypothetical protein